MLLSSPLCAWAHSVRGGKPAEETAPAARHVESAVVGRFGDRRILLTTKDGPLVCVAPGDQEDVRPEGPGPVARDTRERESAEARTCRAAQGPCQRGVKVE